MKTTLNKIREHDPCEDSWKKLLKHLNKTEADDEPLEIKTILDTNGIEDAVWALRAVDGHDKDIRLFTCDCAESVLRFFESRFPNDNRPRKAIEIARRFANGECNKDKLSAANAAASDAAWVAASDADRAADRAVAWAAAWAAARAAFDASDAAWAAARAGFDASDAAYAAIDAASDAEKKKQVEFLMKYV